MIGGFIGTLLRFAVIHITLIESDFPIPTLLVNTIGCFILGWFSTYIAQLSKVKQVRNELTPLIGTGVIGSFTTFSAFSVETVFLLESHAYFSAGIYILLNIIVGLLFVFIGRRFALSKYREDETT